MKKYILNITLTFLLLITISFTVGESDVKNVEKRLIESVEEQDSQDDAVFKIYREYKRLLHIGQIRNLKQLQKIDSLREIVEIYNGNMAAVKYRKWTDSTLVMPGEFNGV